MVRQMASQILPNSINTSLGAGLRPCTGTETKVLPLAELAAISNLFGCLLQKFLNMLVRLRLQPRLFFNPVRYLNRSVHSDVVVEVPSPMQVGFNEDEFLGRDLCQARSG